MLLILSIPTALAQNIERGKIGYKVVINHEEQYSIWPVNQKNPQGWTDTKMRGNQKKCQQYIEEVWTDMRPLSIQKMNLSKKNGVCGGHQP